MCRAPLAAKRRTMGTQFGHRGAASLEALEPAGARLTRAQARDLAAQRGVLHHAPGHRRELVEVERLEHVVGGPRLHGVRRSHAVGRLDLGPLLLEALLQPPPGGELVVDDQDVAVDEMRSGFSAWPGGASLRARGAGTAFSGP